MRLSVLVLELLMLWPERQCISIFGKSAKKSDLVESTVKKEMAEVIAVDKLDVKKMASKRSQPVTTTPHLITDPWRIRFPNKQSGYFTVLERISDTNIYNTTPGGSILLKVKNTCSPSGQDRVVFEYSLLRAVGSVEPGLVPKPIGISEKFPSAIENKVCADIRALAFERPGESIASQIFSLQDKPGFVEAVLEWALQSFHFLRRLHELGVAVGEFTWDTVAVANTDLILNDFNYAILLPSENPKNAAPRTTAISRDMLGLITSVGKSLLSGEEKLEFETINFFELKYFQKSKLLPFSADRTPRVLAPLASFLQLVRSAPAPFPYDALDKLLGDALRMARSERFFHRENSRTAQILHESMCLVFRSDHKNHWRKSKNNDLFSPDDSHLTLLDSTGAPVTYSIGEKVKSAPSANSVIVFPAEAGESTVLKITTDCHDRIGNFFPNTLKESDVCTQDNALRYPNDALVLEYAFMRAVAAQDELVVAAPLALSRPSDFSMDDDLFWSEFLTDVRNQNKCKSLHSQLRVLSMARVGPTVSRILLGADKSIHQLSIILQAGLQSFRLLRRLHAMKIAHGDFHWDNVASTTTQSIYPPSPIIDRLILIDLGASVFLGTTPGFTKPTTSDSVGQETDWSIRTPWEIDGHPVGFRDDLFALIERVAESLLRGGLSVTGLDRMGIRELKLSAKYFTDSPDMTVFDPVIPTTKTTVLRDLASFLAHVKTLDAPDHQPDYAYLEALMEGALTAVVRDEKYLCFSNHMGGDASASEGMREEKGLRKRSEVEVVAGVGSMSWKDTVDAVRGTMCDIEQDLFPKVDLKSLKFPVSSLLVSTQRKDDETASTSSETSSSSLAGEVVLDTKLLMLTTPGSAVIGGRLVLNHQTPAKAVVAKYAGEGCGGETNSESSLGTCRVKKSMRDPIEREFAIQRAVAEARLAPPVIGISARSQWVEREKAKTGWFGAKKEGAKYSKLEPEFAVDTLTSVMKNQFSQCAADPMGKPSVRVILMEMVGMTLATFFAQLRSTQPDELVRCVLVVGLKVVNMLRRLHSMGVLHNDLHLGNVAFKTRASLKTLAETIETQTLVFIDFDKSLLLAGDQERMVSNTVPVYARSHWSLRKEPLGRRDDLFRFAEQLLGELDVNGYNIINRLRDNGEGEKDETEWIAERKEGADFLVSGGEIGVEVTCCDMHNAKSEESRSVAKSLNAFMNAIRGIPEPTSIPPYDSLEALIGDAIQANKEFLRERANAVEQ